jgi:hypothetical protein
MAVWRYYTLSGAFWYKTEKNSSVNGLREYEEFASKDEIEAFNNLMKITWNQVCVEVGNYCDV